MSGRLPGYAEETAPIVRELVRALQAQDEVALAPLLIEGSESDWGLRLFGLGPLIFLLYMHLECDEFVLPRFARRGGREVLVEVGWVTGSDEHGRAIYDPRRLSTVTVRRRGEQWGISDVNPAPLDHPLTLSEAQDVVSQAVEEGRGGNPLSFPLGVLTGAYQLKRLGKEPLDEVEELFVTGMEESSFGVPEIIRAVRLWREFKGSAAASSHRPQVYGAAV
ncbi:MAG: hypothetical protein OEV76_07430, partial [Anaerolineae bacterium]|nr:hypothetical protein [Anaerolineae bacterium]